ncbi:MAG: hypothetical protein LUG16_07390 [Candidatus Gastranaerophilales bacterium]|nr:hypothetical protein [Candidatus Gastranaerophilales bacterium]
MYKNVNLEVIYIFILTDVNNFDKLLNFFNLNSMFDIRTYFLLRSIFINSYELSRLKTILTDDRIDKQTKLLHIKKFREFLTIFIKTKTVEINITSTTKKLNNAIKVLEKYKNELLCSFLFEICSYLNDNMYEKKNSFLLYSIFNSIEEYLDLFLDADKILFNNKIIDKQFKAYFDLLHITPQNICFINKKYNIKIMQNFFPFEILYKIFNLLKYKKIQFSNKKYFLLEYDKKLVTKNAPELLLHETGHFLNLKIYNFQKKAVNELCMKDKTVNIEILNWWLNEIIADIIAQSLNCNFINTFNLLPAQNDENIKYPPTSFRKAILEQQEYDFSIFKNNEILRCALIIFNNLDLIKKIVNVSK